MAYTEQREQGKSLRALLLTLRLAVVRFWLRNFGPRWTVGVLCLLKDEQGRVCLLKHKGRPKPWGLPGGLIRWPEGAVDGLRRELFEELGLEASAVAHLRLRETLTSEKFPMMELVFEAEQPIARAQSLAWKIQTSEIEEVSWWGRGEIESAPGILERHRSLLLSVLRSSEP